MPQDPLDEHPRPADPTRQPLPLDGLLVADFSRVVAGPNLAMTLGDLGAQVIKVERPGCGDDTRSWGPPWAPGTGDAHEDRTSTYFLAVNRNKRSVTLDLGDPDDAALARVLADRADVMVENFLPGTLERFGLGWDELHKRNPRLVLCSILGFGHTPEAARLPGYDLLAQAAGGLMSITGAADGPPTKVGVAVVDILASLHGTIGVLAALEERHRTGRGQHLSVSLLDTAVAALLNQGSGQVVAGVTPERLGNDHPSITPYSTYDAADRPFVIACGNDGQFVALAEAMGRPELAADPRFATNAARVEHRAELRAEIDASLSTATAAAWIERFGAAGVPAGPINDVAEAIELSRQLGLDPIVTALADDGSAVATIRNPVRLHAEGTDGEPRHEAAPAAPPSLGEHDAEIRAWLSRPSG